MKAWILLCALLTPGMLIGCGGGDESADGSSDNTGGSAKTNSSDPNELCQAKCDAMVAPKCERTASDFATTCMTACKASFENYPGCKDQLVALNRCAVNKETYTCTQAGAVEAGPPGGCAAEALDCMSCTNQDILSCF